MQVERGLIMKYSPLAVNPLGKKGKKKGNRGNLPYLKARRRMRVNAFRNW